MAYLGRRYEVVALHTLLHYPLSGSFATVTLGGATLFLVFGIIYLYESFFGGGIDLSPLSDAATSSETSGNIPV
jgi:hypothetical protein